MLWNKILFLKRALQLEKGYLFINPSRISRQAPVRANYPVAGDNYGNPLRPTALPTACADILRSPFFAAILFAISPYVAVSP